ncbi:hypothetical protein Trydic_g3551 [Trypoxylus dichotomus]
MYNECTIRHVPWKTVINPVIIPDYKRKAVEHWIVQKSHQRVMIKTLEDRAARICEPQHIEQEFQHLNQALQANGYGNPLIKRAVRPNNSKRTANEQLSRDWQVTAYLPYIKGVTIYKPTQQLRHQLRSAKDPRDILTSTGVYRIPCSCGLVYIGTTKPSINTKLKEHKRNCRLGQTDKSAVAENALQDGDHNINFAKQLLSTLSHYHTRLQREAIEIHKHPGNLAEKKRILQSTRFGTRFCETRQSHVPLTKLISAGPITAARQTTNHSTLNHRTLRPRL